MNEYTKLKRQRFLRMIIEEKGVGDQPHLLNELKKHDIVTTQATISRDLQELGFVKVRIEPGLYKYEARGKTSKSLLWEQLQILFKNFVTDVKSTNNLILIKTSPGNANGVASLIDGLQRKEILGTIAGDDTILVVVDSEENRKDVEKDFQDLL